MKYCTGRRILYFKIDGMNRKVIKSSMTVSENGRGRNPPSVVAPRALVSMRFLNSTINETNPTTQEIATIDEVDGHGLANMPRNRGGF
jgi:hypothetical protein